MAQTQPQDTELKNCCLNFGSLRRLCISMNSLSVQGSNFWGPGPLKVLTYLIFQHGRGKKVLNCMILENSKGGGVGMTPPALLF